MSAVDQASAKGATGAAEIARRLPSYAKARKAELLAQAKFYASKGDKKRAKELRDEAEVLSNG